MMFTSLPVWSNSFPWIADNSSCLTCLPWKRVGTWALLLRISAQIPSTIAVLPTPASPISTGEFFSNRFSEIKTCLISSCLPQATKS